jgi:hypothetical protein
MTSPPLTPAALRELAKLHLGDGPPYVEHLYEACCALRHAADLIDTLERALGSLQWDMQEIEGQAIEHPDDLKIEWVKNYARASLERMGDICGKR